MRNPKRLNSNEAGCGNDAGVFFARTGYYKGTEVTVTHRNGTQVWLDDYPIKHKNSPTEYGMWVPNESVTYKD